MAGRFSIGHIAASLNLRSALYNEIKRAKEEGKIMPKNLLKRMLRHPHMHEEYIWLLRFIEKNEKITLIDVGGHKGYWAEFFIEYFPNTTVYAFEPVQDMYE